MKKFRCITFGCRVNQYESQAIREQLVARGYEEANEGSPADLLVVNSCTVTEAADQECVALVRGLHKKHPTARIVVAGCLVQKDSALFKEIPGVCLLAGTGRKHRIPELLDKLDPWRSEPMVELEIEKVYAPLKISSFEGRCKVFLKVQDGCDRACAFCKIPLVRGRSRSRELLDLLDEIQRLVAQGFREITLAGVALGLWGRDFTPPLDLAGLVEVVDRLPGQFRVRLSSLDPRDLDDRFLRALAGSSKLCRHLHLSLQSGSDSVLARMNRGYTADWYASRVEEIRRTWPDFGLTTDLITGFPGEGEKEFEETLDFCRRMNFLKVHVFPYSRRRGTSAWFLKGQMPRSEAKRKGRILQQVAGRVSESFRRSFVGTLQEVLPEQVVSEVGVSQEPLLTGFTGQFARVEFRGSPDLIGRLLPIKITGLTRDGLSGELVHFLTRHP